VWVEGLPRAIKSANDRYSEVGKAARRDPSFLIALIAPKVMRGLVWIAILVLAAVIVIIVGSHPFMNFIAGWMTGASLANLILDVIGVSLLAKAVMRADGNGQ
jgi:hypothetical protein